MFDSNFKSNFSFASKAALGLFLILAYTSVLFGASDLLFLDDGTRIEGTYVSSTIDTVLFQKKTGETLSYPKKRVPIVVLGKKEISTWQGVWPGVPQYMRNQKWKTYVMVSGVTLALAGVAYGASQYFLAERELQDTSIKKTRKKVEELQSQQKQASILAAAFGVVLAGIYAWHLHDWLVTGDNYDSYLSFHQYGEIREKEQGRVTIHFLYGADERLSLKENLSKQDFGPSYQLTAQVAF